jgi:hypothetical protein
MLTERLMRPSKHFKKDCENNNIMFSHSENKFDEISRSWFAPPDSARG